VSKVYVDWNTSLPTKSFIHQQTHYLLILENSKIYIKTAPTCFGPRPSSGSLHFSLAKDTLMLQQSVKLSHRVLCSGVAARYVQVYCVCCVLCRARLALHSTPILPIVLT
jgi:hypothetical protein